MAYSLGRLPAPDSRDRNFLLSAVLPVQSPRRSKYYWSDWFGDQGNTSSCVGFSWTHFLTCGPTTQSKQDWNTYALSTYSEAQRLDEWDGEDYEGTSVRAGAKALQAQGFIAEYRWAFTTSEIVTALLEVGPVVMGTVWMDSMFWPDAKGILHLDGNVVGGHAYLLDGVNVDKGLVRIKNSWNRGWGIKGRAFLSFSDLWTLLSQEGEACLATEIRP